MGGNHSEVGNDDVPARGDAGRRIEVEERSLKFVRDSVIRVAICLRKFSCCLRVPGRAVGVEVSYDDVVITEIDTPPVAFYPRQQNMQKQ